MHVIVVHTCNLVLMTSMGVLPKTEAAPAAAIPAAAPLIGEAPFALLLGETASAAPSEGHIKLGETQVVVDTEHYQIDFKGLARVLKQRQRSSATL